MNPKSQFENLEIMSRERATLAKKEAERWLEAEEWKQLRESPDPVIERLRPFK